MPDEQPKVPQPPMSKELPMPRYNYQRSAPGCYISTYDEHKDRKQPSQDGGAPVVQNIKLAI